MTDKHTGAQCRDCYGAGYKAAVEDLSPDRAILTGLAHINMHSNDTCDCGRSYGEIARAAIKTVEGDTTCGRCGLPQRAGVHYPNDVDAPCPATKGG
jgi:hypothetical protein